MSVMSCMEPDVQPTAAQMAAMAPALSSAVAAMNGLNRSRTGWRSTGLGASTSAATSRGCGRVWSISSLTYMPRNSPG